MTDDGNSTHDTGPSSLDIVVGDRPSQIGPYRILDVLGEGGMSIVYLAEQSQPVKRRVALKILKAGMDSKQVLARFESERQALAVLDHPNVAKIFDGGIAESGRPYFVMEQVKGIPITDYCDDQRLSNEERLKLFIKVCSAVQHAHVKGLIHRDLKPSNILVGVVDGQPQPKIIDFGIAKATTTTLSEATLYTRIGQIVGTPQYMSPEQADLTGIDIDTRTDIYSLGVVLYELLVGAVPLQLQGMGEQDVHMLLREKNPSKPSTRFTDLGDTRDEIAKVRRTEPNRLRQQLQGDLDWIVMRAIEKDRERRYETANALAMDCRRFLNRQPVLARPPSPGYLLKRFVQRNRLVVVAGSIAILAIIAGAAVATLGFLRATAAEQVARQEAETASRVSDFLVQLFEVSDPSEARGNSITAREILDKGAARVEEDLRTQPRVQVTMLDTIGSVYKSLGLYSDAETLLVKARTLAGEIYSVDDPRLTKIDRSLGELYFAVSRFDEAEPVLLSVLKRDTATYGRLHERIAYILNVLSAFYNKLDRLDKAEQFAQDNLSVRASLYGESSPEFARGLHTLARAEREKGRYAEALEHAKRALAILDTTLPSVHPSVAAVLGEVSINLSEQGLLEEQEPYLLRALEIDLKVYGPKHNDYADSLGNVGIFYAKQDKFEQAEPYFLRALATTEAALGPVHDSVGFRYYNLGYFYGDMQQYDKAETYMRRSIEIWTEVFDENHGSNAWAWNGLAQNYRERGMFDSATDAALRGLGINEEKYGADHQNTAASVLILANIARDEGRFSDAIPLYERALASNAGRFGERAFRTIEVLEHYLVLLERSGMATEAAVVRQRLASAQE